MDMGCCYSEFHALCDHQTENSDFVTSISRDNTCRLVPHYYQSMSQFLTHLMHVFLKQHLDLSSGAK